MRTIEDLEQEVMALRDAARQDTAEIIRLKDTNRKLNLDIEKMGVVIDALTCRIQQLSEE